jgi:hypothetical protein
MKFKRSMTTDATSAEGGLKNVFTAAEVDVSFHALGPAYNQVKAS